ncbi:hypothetical protein P280DRAFT_12073 [Massarina eburnea CBS 473.64]|uniref:PLC-like phosphodiesterase n=1 Tax=Massarina eburnea CBS 473.64 TaxID=1395130 RepID=A0A6A6SGN6_9PLEO|nr:hypothetical protein P280DRAFT_12073 [Massarina eburnea CBS 473.64]
MFLRTILSASALLFTSVFAQTACNNSPSLCNKAYNNVTYLGTHDAAFLRDASTNFNTAGNQFYNATVQLSAGVRLLTAQVHKYNSTSGPIEWHLCHTTCSLLDAGTLESWLGEIKTWMDANPTDVVTVLLVNSDNASGDILGEQFNSSGISRYAYTPPSSTTLPKTWPTLDNLISNGTRLMSFVASMSTPSASYPFLMDEFTYLYENSYENESPSEFSCDPNRPTNLDAQTAKSSGRMFLMNHFLYSTQLFGIQTPNVTYTNVTNAASGAGSLGNAIQNCTSVYSKPPNFVLVDFFNVGPAIQAVDNANGVTSAQGRKSVSTALVDETASRSAGTRSTGSVLAVIVAVMAAVGFSM